LSFDPNKKPMINPCFGDEFEILKPTVTIEDQIYGSFTIRSKDDPYIYLYSTTSGTLIFDQSTSLLQRISVYLYITSGIFFLIFIFTSSFVLFGIIYFVVINKKKKLFDLDKENDSQNNENKNNENNENTDHNENNDFNDENLNHENNVEKNDMQNLHDQILNDD
jgi:hypothetical protein